MNKMTNKDVMLCVSEKWCEFITAGLRTVDLRNTKPGGRQSVRCYIYCSCGEYARGDKIYALGTDKQITVGYVIGECICSKFYPISAIDDNYKKELSNNGDNLCMTSSEIKQYLGNRRGYGWKITEYKLYEEPIKVSNFVKINSVGEECSMNRAPVSWCYCRKVK